MIDLFMKWWEERSSLEYVVALVGVDKERDAYYEVRQSLTFEYLTRAPDMQYLYHTTLERLVRNWSREAGFNVHLIATEKFFVLAEAMDVVIEGEWRPGAPNDYPRLHARHSVPSLSYMPRTTRDEVQTKRRKINPTSRIPLTPKGWRF